MKIQVLVIASVLTAFSTIAQAKEAWDCSADVNKPDPFIGHVEIIGDKLFEYGDSSYPAEILQILPTEPGALVATKYRDGMFISIVFNRATGRIKQIGQHVNATYEERFVGSCRRTKLFIHPISVDQ